MPYRATATYVDNTDDSIAWASSHGADVMLSVHEKNEQGVERASIILSFEDARAFAEEILSILEGNDA